MLFRVRGTGRGESVSTGTDGTHFVREPVGGRLSCSAIPAFGNASNDEFAAWALSRYWRDKLRLLRRAEGLPQHIISP